MMKKEEKRKVQKKTAFYATVGDIKFLLSPDPWNCKKSGSKAVQSEAIVLVHLLTCWLE